MDAVGKNTELLVQSIKNCSAYKQGSARSWIF